MIGLEQSTLFGNTRAKTADADFFAEVVAEMEPTYTIGWMIRSSIMEQAKAKFFALSVGASVLMAALAQAEMVITPQHAQIDSAQQMLPLCQKEIAQGRPGVCTGYIIAVALEMAVHREASGCLPGYLEYDDMLRAVVPGIGQEVQSNPDVHMRVATEDALAKWAKAKYCKEMSK